MPPRWEPNDRKRDERALKIYHHGTRVLIGFLVAVLGSPFGVRFVALPSLNNRVTWRCQMCSTLHVPLLKIPPGFPVPLRGTQVPPKLPVLRRDTQLLP